MFEVLGSLRGTRFIYIPNPGNAGDSIIAHATYQIFEQLGLEFDVGDEQLTYPGRIIVWGGGGNCVRPYVNIRDFLRKNCDEQIIILPHTFRDYGETLSSLTAKCTIFCRDKPSLKFVREMAPHLSVQLWDDLAFAVDLDATISAARNFPLPLVSDRELLRRNVKRILLTTRYKLRSPKVLNCFRTDLEKTSIPVPTPNIDISKVYATGIMSEKFSLDTTYRMMRFVESFEIVNTNRLHVAILAAKLGKVVHFHDNSYGKNRSVFDHSMRGRFTNVIWCGPGGAGELRDQRDDVSEMHFERARRARRGSAGR